MTRIEGYSSHSCREQVMPQASNKQNKTTRASSTFHQQRRLLLLMRIAFSMTRHPQHMICAHNPLCLYDLCLQRTLAPRRGGGLEREFVCDHRISNFIHRHANTRFSSGKYMAPNCNAVTLLYLHLVSLTLKETSGIYTHP
jgi:hypothetical protein